MRILVILTFLLLTACETTAPVMVDRLTVIQPPNSMYRCPSVSDVADIKKLTDLVVAQKLLEYAQARDICQDSLSSIKTYLVKVKKQLETKSKKQV